MADDEGSRAAAAASAASLSAPRQQQQQQQQLTRQQLLTYAKQLKDRNRSLQEEITKIREVQSKPEHDQTPQAAREGEHATTADSDGVVSAEKHSALLERCKSLITRCRAAQSQLKDQTTRIQTLEKALEAAETETEQARGSADKRVAATEALAQERVETLARQLDDARAEVNRYDKDLRQSHQTIERQNSTIRTLEKRLEQATAGVPSLSHASSIAAADIASTPQASASPDDLCEMESSGNIRKLHSHLATAYSLLCDHQAELQSCSFGEDHCGVGAPQLAHLVTQIASAMGQHMDPSRNTLSLEKQSGTAVHPEEVAFAPRQQSLGTDSESRDDRSEADTEAARHTSAAVVDAAAQTELPLQQDRDTQCDGDDHGASSVSTAMAFTETTLRPIAEQLGIGSPGCDDESRAVSELLDEIARRIDIQRGELQTTKVRFYPGDDPLFEKLVHWVWERHPPCRNSNSRLGFHTGDIHPATFSPPFSL